MKNIIKFRLFLWLILAVVTACLIYQGIVPSGKISYVYDFTPHQKNALDEVGGINRSIVVGGLMPPTSDIFGAGFTIT